VGALPINCLCTLLCSPSAQVKSTVLLAGLNAPGQTVT
jgi:hypothetical protein